MKFTVQKTPKGPIVVGPNGELLWTAATEHDLIVWLVNDMIRERQRRVTAEGKLGVEAARATTAIRVAQNVLKPLLLDSIMLLRELDKQNGDRCMLGDLHAQRIKNILRTFDSIT